MVARRARGLPSLQLAEMSKKRADGEKALRDEEARLALIEAQKVGKFFALRVSDMVCMR